MDSKKDKKKNTLVPNDKNPNEVNEELLVEWNLLRILGMYFCLDNKKAAQLTEATECFDTVNDPKEITKQPARIVPNPTYGHPSLGAFRVFFGVLRKFLEDGFPIPREIHLSQREIMRVINRSAGGFQSKELARYLLQLRATIIEARRYNKKTGKWFFRPFTLISDMYLSGRKNHIDHCYIELDKEIYESINSFYGLRILYKRIEPLSATEKILYTNLFNSFSIVFRKTRKRNGLFYNKDYKSLISEWLPHFIIRKSLSIIKRDQLGKRLDALQKQGLLSRWKIQKNSRNTGFTLYFYPGEAFFEDFDHIQRSRNPQLRMVISENTEGRKKPHEDPKALLNYFFSKLYHEPSNLPDVFTDNDRKFAETVLNQLTLDEAKDFVDYALDEKISQTNYRPIVFRGIETYFVGYLKAKERRRAKKEKEKRRLLQEKYDTFWRETVKSYREQMSQEEITKLNEESRKQVKNEGAHHLMVETMVRNCTNKKIAARYKIPSFEEWQKSQK